MLARLLALFAVAAACSELPPIPQNQCGNGIVERFEDCDEPSPLCVQCRRQCNQADAVSEPTCPGVYACGVDDYCSAPGAFFEPPATSIAFPVLGYRITDVNYDGFGDVVGINQTTLITRYGDVRGELAQSAIITTPTLLGSPIVTHLESPAIDDLVIPVADGLVAYTGELGVPSPRQFPINTGGVGPGNRPDPIDVTQIDKTIATFGPRSKDDSTLTMAILELSAGFPRFDAELQDLCGTGTLYPVVPSVKDTVHSYATPRGTFVAVRPTPDVTCVLQVRPVAQNRGDGESCPDDPNTFPPPNDTCGYTIRAIAALPGFERRVFMDLDGDGCPSLFDASGGANALLEYAGSIASGDDCAVATTDTAWPALGQPGDADLIAPLRLDPPVTNHAPEAVITTYGVYALRTTPSPGITPLYISDRPIDRAKVGDLNGDGLADVVLSAQTPGLDLVRRVPGDDRFLLSRQSTTGPVTKTLIGDFDGDTRADLVFNEQLGSEDRLSIAYGAPGGLSPAIAVDAFRRVQFLAIMEVRDSGDPFGLVDDLLAVDLEVGETVPEITLLHGSSNRTMLSYFGNPIPDPTAQYRGVVAGHFVDVGDSEDILDLLAFQAVSGGANLHVLAGLPGGNLGDGDGDPFGVNEPPNMLIGACPTRTEFSFCLELASFVSVPAAGKPDVVLGVDAPLGRPPLLLRVEPRTGAAPLVTTHPGVFADRGFVRNLEAIDVDHDGDREVVAAFKESARGNDGYLAICEVNDNADIVSCIDVAADVIGDAELECTSFGRGHVTPPCEIGERPFDAEDLVVSCRKGTGAALVSSIFHLRPDAGVLGVGRLLVEEFGVRFDDVQLGDVTGDGVDDLLIGVDTGGIAQLQVRAQRSARNSNVCFD